jgi:hypothetical protein
MSCVPITPEMAYLLERLADWPNIDMAELRESNEWERARSWGWVMESGELTGTGWGHVQKLPRGHFFP